MSTCWESLRRNEGNCQTTNECANRWHGLICLRMLNTCGTGTGDLSVFTDSLVQLLYCDMLPWFLITPGECSIIPAFCAPTPATSRTVPVKKVFWTPCIICTSELSYVYFLGVLKFLGFLFILRSVCPQNKILLGRHWKTAEWCHLDGFYGQFFFFLAHAEH